MHRFHSLTVPHNASRFHNYIKSSVWWWGVGKVIIIIDRFYIALFSAFEQTHCAREWFYMNEQLFIVRFWSTEVVYSSCDQCVWSSIVVLAIVQQAPLELIYSWQLAVHSLWTSSRLLFPIETGFLAPGVQWGAVSKPVRVVWNQSRILPSKVYEKNCWDTYIYMLARLCSAGVQKANQIKEAIWALWTRIDLKNNLKN